MEEGHWQVHTGPVVELAWGREEVVSLGSRTVTDVLWALSDQTHENVPCSLAGSLTTTMKQKDNTSLRSKDLELNCPAGSLLQEASHPTDPDL